MVRRRIRSSRLARTSEKQNKKQAILFTLGIIILIGILIQFGPTLINVFGNTVYMLRGGDKSDTKQLVGKEILQPPTLLGIPEATQSSHITFSGSAPDSNGSVEIYVNDDLATEVKINDKTDFSVPTLSISKGTNTIKARFVKGNTTSPFSSDTQVNYFANKPSLDVSFPIDGASFTKADKSITVTGETDPDNTVLVNSFRAIVDSNGKFTYLLTLNDGDNQITIEAQNPAGTVTQKQIKVTYHE